MQLNTAVQNRSDEIDEAMMVFNQCIEAVKAEVK